MMEEMNVVLLHVVYDTYYTGIDRYIEMYERGMARYPQVAVHRVFLVSNRQKLFPQIGYTDGRLTAVVPMPLNEDLMFQKDCFWKTRCWSLLF